MTRGLLACAVLAVASTAGAQPAALTLDDAIAEALKTNETAKLAAQKLAQARAAREEAHGMLLPTLAASGTYTRRAAEVTRQVGDQTIVVQAANGLSSNVSLNSTLFNASAFPLFKRASRNVEASELSLEEARRDLALDTAESFFAVLSAEALVQASRDRVSVAAGALKDAQARLEAGLASRNEVTRSELEVATAQLAVTRAVDAVARARASLGFLLSREVDMPLAVPADAPPIAGDEKTLGDKATASRADLKALGKQVEAAELFAREPWLRLVPSLGLAATFRATNEAGLSGRNWDANAALTLNWVLYDGGVRYAQAHGRAAEAEQARLTLAQQERSARLQIKLAMQDLATANASLEQVLVAQKVAAQNAVEVKERFGQGLATAFERADATVKEYEANAELVRQQYAQRLARLNLVRALGDWPGAQR